MLSRIQKLFSFKYSSAVFAAVLLATTFGTGMYVGAARSTTHAESFISFFVRSTTPPENVDLTDLWTVWRILDQSFVPTTASSTISTNEQKVWGAIEGLTKSYGDPYTVFFPPQEAKEFQESVSGNFEGVGMEIDVRDGMLTIVSPLPGTPAEKAGLRAGDLIPAIDGKSTEGLTVSDAVGLIRGTRGTTVTLLIVRDGGQPFEVPVVRGVIQVPTIKTEHRQDGVFVISLYNFSALSSGKFREAMREFVSSGSDRLVLDLRSNPGGYLDAAVEMASYFLPLGETIVIEDAADKHPRAYYRSKGYNVIRERGINLKMVVLVNKGSASASEILAGALREHNVATLIGETTFGKGSVQELIELGGGASLKITVARWLTPNGTSISENGLTPDIAVERTVEDFKEGKDPQMDEAIKFLLSK